MDHRKLIQQYDLGHIEEHSPGLIHFHPNGQRVMRKLRDYVLKVHEDFGYMEVSSPMILHKDMWKKSGHWDKYQDLMFVVRDDDYAVKPMSCPGQINIFKNKRRSYRELPQKMFEFGHVHRNEPSGALSGWMRLRGFVQDDSHVFCLKSQIQEVIEGFIGMSEKVYRDFGFDEWEWQLSLRPAQRSGSDEVWDEAENALRKACMDANIVVVEKEGEGAFYGPKLEVILKDSLGRSWQCGVAQLDFVLPQRFNLSAQNEQDKPEDVVLVHHAVLGSLERFLSIVLENNGSLPLWLAPIMVAVCPIGAKNDAYAIEVVEKLRKKGVAVSMENNNSLSARLKSLDERLVPYRLVVGSVEEEQQKVSLRLFHEKAKEMPLLDAIEQLSVQSSPPF